MKDLFDLLPTVHRVRDAAHGDQLRTLLTVIGREVQLVEDDIARLYDNWFIETCDEWVVPYIADLLGIQALAGSASAAAASGFSQRSYVAHTLAYRRRKGTAAVLEQLASDITGWRCKAVEFFEHTASTQHANHPRPGHPFTIDIRSTYRNQFYGGPFDQAAHLVDARHIDNRRGRHNVPNVGLFLWKLQAYRLTGVSARPIGPTRYTCDPLGLDVPVFNLPQTETAVTQATTPLHVPMPVSRHTLQHDLPLYYGEGSTSRVLRVSVNDTVVPAAAVTACTLSDSGAGWAHAPQPGGLAIDPELGRVAFDVAPPGEVLTSYAYGFGGDLGGGPYDRRGSLEETLQRGVTWQMGVTRTPPAGQTSIVSTLAAAVQAWNAQPPGTSGVIALMDSRTHAADLDTPATRIAVAEGSQLVIVAAGWPAEIVDGTPMRQAGRLAPLDVRPHLRGAIEVRGTAPANSASPGRLVLNGVLLEGSLRVVSGHLGALDLAHATLAPGASSLSCDANEALTVGLTRTISGSLDVSEARSLRVLESIVLGPVHAADTTIDASTVLGTTRAQTLAASNSILLGKVTVERRQEGCIRFSYLPLASESPRRYRCQPEDAAQASRVRPAFESTRYGDPALVQLGGDCAVEIATGADDEGEMGAWHFVQAPQRLRSLRLALDEYLRFGLEAGVMLVRQSPGATPSS
ncbi:MAG TPA: hypothetical protein VM032_19085 [Vicinamibacterales bacterium]|nr:hypothetical protein [Vicinamibacterales bacterium]